MPDKPKNLGIRETPERHRELKLIATNRGLSIQRLVDLALEAYLDERGENQQPASALTPVANRPWHEKLDYILEHADLRKASFIKGNIEVFHENTKIQVDQLRVDKGRVSARGNQKGGKKPIGNRPSNRKRKTLVTK